MPTDTHRDSTGRTKPTPFRLAPDTLADLDYLADSLTEETGVPHTRAGVIRALSRRERSRRQKEGAKKSGSKS